MQAARRLADSRWRKRSGLLLLEGGTIVKEALRAGVSIEEVFLSATAWEQGRLGEIAEMLAQAGVVRGALVPDDVLATLSTMKTPHDLVAVARHPQPGDGQPRLTGGMVVALDGLQDPGNVGTILRTALAFGCQRAWLGEPGVDPYHPKVIRAAAGSLFWFSEVLRVDLAAALARAKDEGMVVAALDAHQGAALGTQDPLPLSRLILVAGSEGAGISPPVARHVDVWLRIPTDPRVESLNVAVAAALALYELAKGSVRGRRPAGERQVGL